MSGGYHGGKSSVARILATSLGYPIISAGGMQREIAASMGRPRWAAGTSSRRSDRSAWTTIDAYTKMLGETRDHIIVDSRTARHFIPPAFKGVPISDPLVGAERVFSASRSEEQ